MEYLTATLKRWKQYLQYWEDWRCTTGGRNINIA